MLWGKSLTAPWLMAASSLQHVIDTAEHPFVIHVFWAHFYFHSFGKRDAAKEEVLFSYT